MRLRIGVALAVVVIAVAALLAGPLSRGDRLSDIVTGRTPLLAGANRASGGSADLSGTAALVVVAGTFANGAPDLSRARAFIAEAGTPFLYRAGTWHASLFAFGEGGTFLMGMRENGTPADCEIFELTTALRVEAWSWDAGIG